MNNAKEDLDEFVSLSETLVSNMRMLTHRDELRRSKDFHYIFRVLNPKAVSGTPHFR